MRKLITFCAVVLFGVLALLAGSAPAYADTSGGTINTGGGNANLRSGPGTNYWIVGSIANGAAVHVECVGTGTSVTGPFGTTTLWDEIGNSEWVTDAYVNTGTNFPIAMPCGYVQGRGYGYGSGSIVTNVLPGCDFTNGGGGSNYGSTRTGSDWWEISQGCDLGYWYTYGNGPAPSGVDYAIWGYYPGAYATCRIHIHIPFQEGPKPFTTLANYTIYTGHGGTTWLGTYGINQAASAGQTVDIGAWQPDGSGYLRVRMDDSSAAGNASQIVAANSVEFVCTSEY